MKIIKNLGEIVLDEEGLKIKKRPQDVRKNNIIVGKNGAGKSRFLRALKKHYKDQIVYCDFTKLKSSNEEIQGDAYETEESLYDHGRFHNIYYSNIIFFDNLF